MAVTPSGSAPGEHTGKRFNLRLSSLVTACFLILAAIVLAYVGGVMSGRSYTERQMAEREKLRAHAAVVPSAAVPAGEAALEEGRAALPGSDVLPEDMAQGNTAQGQKILAAEDLRFARALRIEPGEELDLEALPPIEEKAGNGGPQGEKAQAGAQAVPATAPFAPAVDPARQPQVPAEAGLHTNPAGQIHDYVFQVGAFKDEDSVDALRQRLEGRGLRTRMLRQGKVLVVMVLLRGTAERAAEIPQITKELRLGEPLLRSKKPVAP